MKLCVFPNDPLIAYFNKGELKERYYNPNNLFDEVHVISFIDNDVESSKVKLLFGDANFKIHEFGKLSLFNKSRKKNKVLKLLKQIRPDVIRSYNARLEGWIGAYCSKKLKIPFFVSLHVQYDTKREFEKNRNYKKYLVLKYFRKNIEPYVLKSANKITGVYKIIEPYVIDITGKKPEILYNRIDLKLFNKELKKQNEKPLIISVGRLTKRKNHDCLLKAVKNLDVNVQIIGDGEAYEELMNLASKLNIQNKITFNKKIIHSEIQNYYKKADLFVSLYNPKIEGLPMPVLEAMATGLPIIISEPVQGLDDGLEDSVLYSEVNENVLEHKIRQIISDKEFSNNLSQKAIEKAKEFDGTKNEKREAEIYQELVTL